MLIATPCAIGPFPLEHLGVGARTTWLILGIGYVDSADETAISISNNCLLRYKV
jgi:hypothetical protein